MRRVMNSTLVLSVLPRVARNGAALVEFTVILPVLVLLLLGAIDVGRAIMVQHKLTEAARAGCRIYAVTTEITKREVRDMVARVMTDANIDG